MKLSHEELCELWRDSKRKFKRRVDEKQHWVIEIVASPALIDYHPDEDCEYLAWFNEMDERYGEGE